MKARTHLLWVVAWWGCSAPEPGPSDPSSVSTGEEVDQEADDDTADDKSLPQPVFANPAEAEDLDDSDGVVEIALAAAPHTHELIDWRTGETLTVEGYAYNGQTPGPTIRARKGDLLRVTLDNQLDDATTIHWHGVDAPWEMDGHTWMIDPIAAGETFTYEVPLEQTGTFWYHPHFDTNRQVDMGLYGVLIVEDPDEDGAFDEDLVLVLDDWIDRVDEVGEEGAVDHGMALGEGLWAVNGLVQPLLELEGGTAVRARVLNAANEGYVALGLQDDGEDRTLARIAGDQGLLEALAEDERVVLAPGDRIELALTPGSEAQALVDHPYDHRGGEILGDAVALLDLEPSGGGDPATVPDLPWTGEATSEDPGTTDVLYVFQGDSSTGEWFINGEVFPDVTVASLDLDQTAVIEVRNLSPTEHPFHLHGLVFEVLSLDGVAPEHRTLEDTVNLDIYGTARLLVTADNPGDWMAHCHILPHGDGGMMTVLRVE